MKLKYFSLILTALILLSCSDVQPRKPVIRKTGSFMKESIERNKALNKVEEQLLMALMQKDTVHTYLSSPNGFWYYYVQRDTTQTDVPAKGDEVLFTYEIKRIDGSVLYSEQELGLKRYRVDKEDLISGLQEGIKLMHPGETVTFLFPSYKAFGLTGEDRVGPSEPLIYTVHLKEIIHKNQ